MVLQYWWSPSWRTSLQKGTSRLLLWLFGSSGPETRLHLEVWWTMETVQTTLAFPFNWVIQEKWCLVICLLTMLVLLPRGTQRYRMNSWMEQTHWYFGPRCSKSTLWYRFESPDLKVTVTLKAYLATMASDRLVVGTGFMWLKLMTETPWHCTSMVRRNLARVSKVGWWESYLHRLSFNCVWQHFRPVTVTIFFLRPHCQHPLFHDHWSAGSGRRHWTLSRIHGRGKLHRSVTSSFRLCSDYSIVLLLISRDFTINVTCATHKLLGDNILMCCSCVYTPDALMLTKLQDWWIYRRNRLALSTCSWQ